MSVDQARSTHRTYGLLGVGPLVTVRPRNIHTLTGKSSYLGDFMRETLCA
jgi:hypothetical protein